MSSALRLLPANSTDRTRVLLRLDGNTRSESVSAQLASLSAEQSLPIRQFFAWPGKRNYEGLWWSSTVRAHVVFESLLEREYLLAADFDPRIVGIAAQPLALLWPKGTVGQRNHVPDFFVRLSNGDGRLVDVRHPDRVDDSAVQFDMTRHVCDEIGWNYEVFTDLGQVELQNLRWLSGYRQDRCAPTDSAAATITDCFADPIPLRVGIHRIARSTGESKDLALANVLHLLWRRRLSVDLCAPLTLDAEVSA